MKNVFWNLGLVAVISALTTILAGEIYGLFYVTAAGAVFVSSIVCTAITILICDHVVRERIAETEEYQKNCGNGNVWMPIIPNHGVSYDGTAGKTVYVPKGIIKKGDTLSPEHRAKISASLKKLYAEKKAQEARIAETHSRSLSRKKSAK